MSDLTYQEAIHLFEQWGFQVESGPRADEVTLILEGPDFRTFTVHPKSVLPQMATVILAVRWRNSTAGCSIEPLKMMAN
jgi:hypothetical protein